MHLRISSPPIVFPCFYGIDMADQDEFIAFGKSVDEISRELGATSVAYLSLEGLLRATRVPVTADDCFCTACFSGEYPCEVPEKPAPSPSSATRRAPAPRWIGEFRAGGRPSAGGCLPGAIGYADRRDSSATTSAVVATRWLPRPATPP